MDQNMSSEKPFNPLKKPMKREIAASHLHSSSPSSFVAEKEEILVEESFINCDLSSNNKPVLDGFSQYSYCYPLMEAMPVPEPIWSTTEPSTMAASGSNTSAMEFEWGDQNDEGGSYTWWVGFLKGLDGEKNNNNNNNNIEEDLKCSMGNIINGSLVFGQCEDYGCELPFVNAISDQSICADEWLQFPTTSEQDEA